MTKAVIVGATGYSGLELIRLLMQHPAVNIHKLYASSQEYESVTEVYPHLQNFVDLPIELIGTPTEADLQALRAEAEVVFLATPSGVSTVLGPLFLKAGFRVIDLSGDYRIKDRETYEHWYGLAAPATAELNQAVYGLAEWFAEDIKQASYIANPGCYATGILLGIAPLLASGVQVKSVIADAKSGVSGAGRGVSRGVHYAEVNENFKAYRVGAHKHIPEIEEVANLLASQARAASQQGDKANQLDSGASQSDNSGKQATDQLMIDMVPHLVPMTRGILSTIYVDLGDATSADGAGTGEWTEESLWAIYQAAYGEASFIRLLAPGQLPETKQVSGTNLCDIAIHLDQRTKRLIIITSIDNLIKGASGQAIQNMNLMLGLAAETGLVSSPLYL